MGKGFFAIAMPAGFALAVAACSGQSFTSNSVGGGPSGGSSAGGSGASGGESGSGGTSGKGGTPGTGGSAGCDSDQCQAAAGQCHTGKCTQTGCTITVEPDGTSCDDGLYCTVNDACTQGQCTGKPRQCPSTSDPCKVAGCDEATNQCETAAPDGTQCDDNSACTSNDKCSNGTCAGTLADLALNATASSSPGGGPPTYGADKLNDGTCTSQWITNSSTSPGWIELDWADAVQIGSIFVDVDDPGQQNCVYGAGRYVASGQVDYWNGSSWQTQQSFTASGDIALTFTSTINTSKLRLSNLRSGTNSNSIIHEVYVFSAHACTPSN